MFWKCLIVSGQIIEGQPHGFTKMIDTYRSIYEGVIHKETRHGWGRKILKDGGIWIGWWKDGNLHGNSRKYRSDGTLCEEGWFEEYSILKEGFRKHA